ncbi:MAG TPA: ergothioneine biosynthesis glutamate--cysteine ligase EgtA [Actinocrinis sp.]|jgi:glutamate--cysteine ligase
MADIRPLEEDEAEARVKGVCFKHGPPRRVGVELEWFLHDEKDRPGRIEPGRLHTAHADLSGLPLSSALTREPGGQLELSSPAAESLTDCVEAAAADLKAVRERLRPHRLQLAGLGHEPWNPPLRLLDQPRYAAMEHYFDRAGPAGRAMMCNTASVQVSLDSGTGDSGPLGYRARWERAHLLGPVLVAAFANSPFSEGRPTGYRSTRQAVWTRLDPARTGAPSDTADPCTAWADYALGAPVLCIRRPGPTWEVPPKGLTFRGWIQDCDRLRSSRPPTADDLDYHLTTLFPPVRPHGHLELRMIDAQRGEDGWIVPLAVTVALMEDPEAVRLVEPVLRSLDPRPFHRAPGNPLWQRAARDALADPALRAAAQACFSAAEQALPRLGAGPAIRAAVAGFRARYVDRGRCPADDLLDRHSTAAAASWASAQWPCSPGRITDDDKLSL